MIDKRLAGKTLAEVEAGDNFSVYLVLRDNLSILPQDDMILKEKDIVVARCQN